MLELLITSFSLAEKVSFLKFGPMNLHLTNMFMFLGTMALQNIPTVEMTLEKPSTSTTNPSGRSSRLSIRVKSIDSSSLETNSDGSPTTLSLIRQILEDQNPRMINPYVCPSDVSVVKIPVKISRLSRGQSPKISNSVGNPLGKSVLKYF